MWLDDALVGVCIATCVWLDRWVGDMCVCVCMDGWLVDVCSGGCVGVLMDE